MNTTYIVLLVLLAIYIPIYIYVRTSEKAKAKGIVPYGPLIMIKTKWGIGLMDRLSKHKQFWHVCGFLSKIISLILMIYIVAILVIDVIMIPSVIGKGGMGIEYALAIPGLNPMLPLVYGWIGLIIAMVVHETAHGIQTRANDMNIESTGILYGVVPLGAFVEPNEEQVQKCSRKARMDLYAAGITTNCILALVLFLVMSACLTYGVTSTYEDGPAIYGVTADSPGYDSEIPTTSIILTVNGEPMDSLDEFNSTIDKYDVYTITYQYHDDKEEKVVELGTYIVSVVSNSPAYNADIPKGSFIKTITRGDVTTDIGSASSFKQYMNGTKAGDVITVTYQYKGYEYTTDNITLTDNKGVGYLGISTNTGGFTFTTPNATMSVATNPFYGCETVSDYAMGAISYIGTPFRGYSPVPESTQWWYDSGIIPDDVFWVMISLIYWTFWLNIVLGVSNALPAIPFDGGFLYIGGVDFILEKLGMKGEKRERYVDMIGSATTWITLMILVLVMFVIIF